MSTGGERPGFENPPSIAAGTQRAATVWNQMMKYAVKNAPAELERSRRSRARMLRRRK